MRTARIWTVLALLIWFQPAQAQPDFTTPLIARLQQDGFAITEVRRTWLGRILIVSHNDSHLREVVLNRQTGEILRDKLFPVTAEADAPVPAPAPVPASTETETAPEPAAPATGATGATGGGGNGANGN